MVVLGVGHCGLAADDGGCRGVLGGGQDGAVVRGCQLRCFIGHELWERHEFQRLDKLAALFRASTIAVDFLYLGCDSGQIAVVMRVALCRLELI